MKETSNTGSEDFLRGLATLALVSVGLFLVTVIFFWPLLLLSLTIFQSSNNNNVGILLLLVTITIQVSHLLALVYIPFPYLYIHRKICHPVRILLMPLVSSIARSESIREKEVTWYNKCTSLPETNDVNILLNSFKHSIRRDLKRKLKLFFRRRISTQTLHSDFLSLKEDIPVIWEHEKRAVRGMEEKHKSVLEEFIKRFLVVFLTSNAYIDRYYDDNDQICALGLFVQSEKVLNNFVYFCRECESQSGIWQCKYCFWISIVLYIYLVLNIFLIFSFNLFFGCPRRRPPPLLRSSLSRIVESCGSIIQTS